MGEWIYGFMGERNRGGIELGENDGVFDAAVALATTASQNDVVGIGS